MTSRGLPIDKERLDEFDRGLQEASVRIRREIREHLDQVSSERGLTLHSYHPGPEGFKVLPADLREKIGDRHFIKTVTEVKRKRTLVDGKNKLVPTEIEVPVAKYPCEPTLYQQWFYDLVNEMDYEWLPLPDRGIYVVARREEFNPNSTKQLETYCTAMGYKIPIVTKKTAHGREQKASLDDKALQKLSKLTKDKLFTLVMEMREVDKLMGTYVKGWQPNGPDGRLHSKFSLNSGTGQLRSSKPNVQNAPSHSGDYGKKFKRIIKANPGRLILNCVAPETLVCMRDLTWKRADEIKKGDAILGFDEHITSSTSRRYFKTSKVTASQIKQSQRLKIITDRGEIIVSPDHRFIRRVSGKGTWVEAHNLLVGHKIRFFTQPWETLQTYEAGWLSGFLDGEGYIGNGGGNKNIGYRSSSLGFGQNDGFAAKHAVNILTKLGYSLSMYGHRKCKQYHVIARGSIPYASIRLIGQLRPVRLLPKVIEMVEGMATWGTASVSAEIKSIEIIDDGPVVAIATTSKTLITNGFLSHNCDYSGYHALMLGYFARSHEYMRLSRYGVHDYLAAYMLQSVLNQAQGSWKSLVWETTRGAMYYRKEGDKYEKELMDLTEAHIRDLPQWLTYSDDQLKAKLKWVKKSHDFLRNKKAKPICIAEGQLVLTQNGLKPIETITLDDRVWDGVEWVSHSGVIFNGYRKVITYEGLTATADHQVYTSKGKIPLAQVAAQQAQLICTGAGGKAIRISQDHQLRDESDQRIPPFTSPVCIVPEDQMGRQEQSFSRSNWRMPNVRSDNIQYSGCKTIEQTILGNPAAMHQLKQPWLSLLWWNGGRDSIYGKGICSMGNGESTTSGLCGDDNRSNRSIRTLREGESSTGDKRRTTTQQKVSREDSIPGGVDTPVGFSFALRGFLHKETRTEGVDRGADYPTMEQQHSFSQGNWEEKTGEIFVKVYDIANAGPRNRFTVSNVLVSNCHSIGFGAQANGIYAGNEESFASKREVENLRDMYFSIFPAIGRFQHEITLRAHRDKKLVSPYGYVRRFYESLKPSWNGGLERGEQASEVIAFLPANTAFCLKKEAMLRLDESGANDRYWLFNEVHDSLNYEPLESQIEEAAQVVYREMTAPSKILVDPELCPDGLVCDVEVSWGPSWGELTEYKI